MTRNVVSFRLDPVHFDLLRKRAGNGTSAGALARELVIRALNEERLNDAVDDRLRAICEEQARLRRDIRHTLQAIIAAATRISLEEAEEHVKRILR